MSISNADQARSLAKKLIREAQKKYPRLHNAFFEKNLLKSIGVRDVKIFNPSRIKLFDDRRYKRIVDRLKDSTVEGWIFWLTHDEQSKSK